jgi:sugar phosphate permease
MRRVSPLFVFRDPEGKLPAEKRALVFGLTWLSYATYYLGRQNYSVCKTSLADQFGLSATNLGDMETGYLVAYAVGQFVSGKLGDRFGGRRVIGIGMLASAGSCAVFGASSSGFVFGIALLVNGFFQATGWPGNVKAMGSWFGSAQRSSMMGFWSTCYQIGPSVATFIATWLLTHASWRAAFFGPAIAVGAVGLAVWFLLPERDAEAAPLVGATPSTGRTRGVLREPVIWSLGAAYFCLKLIRYSILFWRPWYLTNELHYTPEQSGYLSVSFTLGGVLGSVIVGFVADRFFRGRRRQLASGMVVLLAGALFLYPRVASWGMAADFAAMALVGFCLFGPDALICGAAAQDLGGKEEMAMAAGAINGMGSVGSILQGRVTSTISTAYGWNALFYTFVGLALLAAVALRIIRPTQRS